MNKSLGFGSFIAWQFFALQFWLNVQHANPLTVSLYLTPNAIFGVLATFIVSRIAHLVAGHWILAASMLAFAMGPVFFLPQTANTTYWALSMPGIAIATFGPVGVIFAKPQSKAVLTLSFAGSVICCRFNLCHFERRKIISRLCRQPGRHRPEFIRCHNGKYIRDHWR